MTSLKPGFLVNLNSEPGAKLGLQKSGLVPPLVLDQVGSKFLMTVNQSQVGREAERLPGVKEKFP